VNAPAASTPKLLTGLCNLAPTQRGDIIVAYDQKGATAVPLRPEWPATVLHGPRIVGRHQGPMLRRQIASKVKKTRDKLVNKLQQGVQIPENGARLRAKIRFLEEQGRNLNPPTKSLFISYSADDLDPCWLSLVADLAKKRFNFDVRTGFDYSRIQNLLKRCLTGIEESACFLSIMSRPSVVTDSASPGLLYAPSTWVVEEKGMALAMGKPFHLLVSDGIHKDFFQRTTPGLKHTIFQNDDFADFERAAKEALDTLSARYEEIVLDRQILS